MFFIHHLYTAILVAIEEENGLMDSIFSGYKFVSKKQLQHELGSESPAPDHRQTVPPPTVIEAAREVDSHTPV
jgi:Ni/Fe-hydrogenase 1 B-type cytochrome subunit